MKCCFSIFFFLFGQKFQYVILSEVVHLTICKASLLYARVHIHTAYYAVPFFIHIGDWNAFSNVNCWTGIQGVDTQLEVDFLGMIPLVGLCPNWYDLSFGKLALTPL